MIMDEFGRLFAFWHSRRLRPDVGTLEEAGAIPRGSVNWSTIDPTPLGKPYWWVRLLCREATVRLVAVAAQDPRCIVQLVDGIGRHGAHLIARDHLYVTVYTREGYRVYGHYVKRGGALHLAGQASAILQVTLGSIDGGQHGIELNAPFPASA